ncbi:MAG TPA: hypothetical protein VGC14_26690 [Rhizobium sp.]
MTYPTDPKTGQNIVPIPDLLGRRDAIRKAAKDLPDDIYNEMAHGAWKLEIAILRQPAANRNDLRIKLGLWDELISDPPSILDIHDDLWWQLKEDIWTIIAELPAPVANPPSAISFGEYVRSMPCNA